MIRPFESGTLIGATCSLIVWGAHFVFLYAFFSIGCSLGWQEAGLLGFNAIFLVLFAATLGAFAWIALGGLRHLRDWRYASQPPHAGESDEGQDNLRFMSRMGFILAGLSLVGVVWNAVPLFLLPYC